MTLLLILLSLFIQFVLLWAVFYFELNRTIGSILRKKKPDRTGPMKFVVYRAKYYKLTVAFNII